MTCSHALASAPYKVYRPSIGPSTRSAERSQASSSGRRASAISSTRRASSTAACDGRRGDGVSSTQSSSPGIPVRRDEAPPSGLLRTPVYVTILANDRRRRSGRDSLLRAHAVDGLADDVSLASVPSGLLNQVYRNPPKVPSHLSPCAGHVEINRIEDLLRSSDLFSVVHDNDLDGVVMGDPKPVLVLWLHLGPLSREPVPGDDDLEPGRVGGTLGPSLFSVVDNTCAEGSSAGERPAKLVLLFSGQLTGARRSARVTDPVLVNEYPTAVHSPDGIHETPLKRDEPAAFGVD